MADIAATQSRGRPMSREEKKVIFASSLGTVFEWYDFYLYGSLGAYIGMAFFNSYPEATRNIFVLLAFAAGFLVRPFGALVFGRLGDIVGRKLHLPDHHPDHGRLDLRRGSSARLGADRHRRAHYPHRPAPASGSGARRRIWRRRDLCCRTCAGRSPRILHVLDPDHGDARLFLSLLVILAVQTILGRDAFAEWGWRIPFLISVALLGVSVWIRMQMNESRPSRR